jgi:hypothetical protein
VIGRKRLNFVAKRHTDKQKLVKPARPKTTMSRKVHHRKREPHDQNKEEDVADGEIPGHLNRI